MKITSLDKRSKELRQTILSTYVTARRGHILSYFSTVEILRVLYDDILRYHPKDPKWPFRDRFILSKGHGSVAYYTILADKGFFPKKHLNEFCQVDGLLGLHPSIYIPGVELATGSLGHGLPVGVGMALAIKNKNNVFVLLGDGECDEGSVWEAAMSASKHHLDNLTAIIDCNAMQAYGRTADVLALEPFAKKWKSFGFAAAEVDGHDVKALKKIFKSVPLEKGKPSVIICHTVKGKGVSEIENNPAWHHKAKLTDEEVEELRSAIEKY